MKKTEQQTGAALITALLVVALASTVAVAMTSRQQLDIRRTENVLRHDQGMLFARGGEMWAMSILQRDLDADREGDRKDSLDEDWARKLPETLIDNGVISGEIIDLQGRFNLSNLRTPDATPDTQNQAGQGQQPQDPQLENFIRLLRALELDERIAQAVLDWIDSDSETRFPDGAEDSHYLGQEPAYRSANRPLTHVSELRLIRGIDARAYELLAPHLSTLPDPTTVNVNTATRAVLMSLHEQIDATIAEKITEERENSPFVTVDAFIKLVDDLTAAKESQAEILKPLIGVTSHYFQSRADVRTGRSHIILHSTMRRDDNKILVITRQ